MHGISGGSGQQQLGPTIWTEVQFEGSPVKALVDTGSPATIVGLKFALKVLNPPGPGVWVLASTDGGRC